MGLKKTKLTSALLPSQQVVNSSGTVVVKRGRGRPPGTRNKATLIAQGKLLAQQQAKAKAAAEVQQQSPPLPVRGGPTASSTHRVTPHTRLYCTDVFYSEIYLYLYQILSTSRLDMALCYKYDTLSLK